MHILHSLGQKRRICDVRAESASLIGRSGSSVFRLSTAKVSMSLAGSCFSSESALGMLVGMTGVGGGAVMTPILHQRRVDPYGREIIHAGYTQPDHTGAQRRAVRQRLRAGVWCIDRRRLSRAFRRIGYAPYRTHHCAAGGLTRAQFAEQIKLASPGSLFRRGY
jgi:hypothetical protein